MVSFMAVAADAKDAEAMGAASADGWEQVWANAPALTIGLAAVFVMLTLPLLMAAFRRPLPESDAATRLLRLGRAPLNRLNAHGLGASLGPDIATEAVYVHEPGAWVSVGDSPEPICIIQETMHIGREIDNDICLPQKTVHRYHAVIHRTTEGDFAITDLSSAEGNGVVINGQRVRDAVLADRDVIRLGDAVLVFRESRSRQMLAHWDTNDLAKGQQNG